MIRGGPSVSDTIATRVPISSIAKTSVPPSTSVKNLTSAAASPVGV